MTDGTNVSSEDQQTEAGWPGWVKWPVLLVFWTLPALLLASQIQLMYAQEGREVSWWQLFAWQAAGWYFWIPITAAVLWLGRKIPFSRPRWLRFVALHVPLALLVVLVHAVLIAWSSRLIGPPPYNEWPFLQLLVVWLSQRLHLDCLTYAGLLGIGYGVDNYKKYRERELRASQLEGQLAQAQLQALEMQLHPHFLFNTLHAISVLVRKGSNQQAVSMLAGLSDLLRVALDNVGAQEVPLRQELDFLERYLELEQIRFQDRLEVRLDVDPQTLDARIPNLILQPLVENAIRHGIAQRTTAGCVQVSARREQDRLEVQVRDDGPGLGVAGTPPTEGVGLSNTRKRLERLYGSDHRFTMGEREGGGVVAFIQIPFALARP